MATIIQADSSMHSSWPYNADKSIWQEHKYGPRQLNECTVFHIRSHTNTLCSRWLDCYSWRDVTEKCSSSDSRLPTAHSQDAVREFRYVWIFEYLTPSMPSAPMSRMVNRNTHGCSLIMLYFLSTRQRRSLRREWYCGAISSWERCHTLHSWSFFIRWICERVIPELLY